MSLPKHFQKRNKIRSQRRAYRVKSAQSRGKKPRVSVCRSLKYTCGQIINDNEHKTLCSFSSKKLKDFSGDKSAAAKQAPDTEPDTSCKVRGRGYGRLPGPEECCAATADYTLTATSTCASSPEVGARCASSACRDLCGGPRVTGVPTATSGVPTSAVNEAISHCILISCQQLGAESCSLIPTTPNKRLKCPTAAHF